MGPTLAPVGPISLRIISNISELDYLASREADHSFLAWFTTLCIWAVQFLSISNTQRVVRGDV